MLYDNQKTDDLPQRVVSFSYSITRFLIGIVENLSVHDLWAKDTDMDTVNEQIDDLLVRLMEGVEPVARFSGELYLPWFALHNTIVETVQTLDAASWANGYVYQLTPTNLSDVVMFRVSLHEGAYKLIVHYVKASLYGKMLPVLDGVVTTELETIDTYSATTTRNNWYVWDFEVTEGGDCDVYLRVNGKNASSSNYYLVIQSVTLKPVWS